MEVAINKYQGNQKAQRFTMWLSLVSMAMIFAGLTSAFLVRKGGGGNWSGFSLPSVFTFSTFIILFSSATLQVAHIANKKDNKVLTAIGLIITLICGIIFCKLQYDGWMLLVNEGYYPSHNPNPAPQFLFVIVVMHVAHIVAGLFFLTIASSRALWLLRRKDSQITMEEIEYKENGNLIIRTDLLTLFWHFLGVLWVYLYIFLIFNLK